MVLRIGGLLLMLMKNEEQLIRVLEEGDNGLETCSSHRRGARPQPLGNH